MFPVIDRAGTARLGKVSNYWDAFRFAFAEPEARLIMSSRVVQAGEELTLLRAVDIVLWMAHEHPLEDDPPIKP